jgi:lantibiotic modifying enzyme
MQMKLYQAFIELKLEPEKAEDLVGAIEEHISMEVKKHHMEGNAPLIAQLVKIEQRLEASDRMFNRTLQIIGSVGVIVAVVLGLLKAFGKL